MLYLLGFYICTRCIHLKIHQYLRTLLMDGYFHLKLLNVYGGISFKPNEFAMYFSNSQTKKVTIYQKGDTNCVSLKWNQLLQATGHFRTSMSNFRAEPAPWQGLKWHVEGPKWHDYIFIPLSQFWLDISNQYLVETYSPCIVLEINSTFILKTVQLNINNT